ncbi:MAG: exopolysaccharide biosynthesis polyprenyl glycosylphosphotransferase, partial [Trueperaceae bacterium]|nr:exopolysaccharide biosynthesis polyprenyl glycosylphosphotransferase [Trueperaceae bacterium]
RSDRWWWAAAALLGLPWLATGHVWAGMGATGQALATWLIFRSASAVRASVAGDTFPRDVGAGLLTGFAGAIALGLDRVGAWRLDTARSVFDLVAWTGSPALYGHAMLVLAALLAVILPSPRGRVLALALGAVAVLVSGAQEAVLAWLLVAIGLRFVGRRGSRATVVAEWGLIAVMLVVASGLTALVGTGRAGFRVDLGPDATTNLFAATEAPAGAWWYPLGVRFDAAPGVVGGEARTVFAVEKTSADSWSRLQQIVRLEPGRAYVLSLAWRAADGARPGLDGWGRTAIDAPAANLGATWAAGTWRTNASGALEVLHAAAAPVSDGWMRGTVAFRYVGDAPLTWYVGMVPDRRADVGAVTEFAELQLIVGETPVAYVATPPDRGLVDLRTTRFPLWTSALDAIATRPWWGWGPQGYVQATTTLDPSGARQRPVAAHAHSLPLDVGVERGAVGLVGLLLLGAALALRAVQQRDRAMAVVLAAVVLLNLFDTTFLNGAVVYPLAAILGWRAVGQRRVARAQTGLGSAAAVRLTLALADAAVAVVAVAVAASLTAAGPWPDALRGSWTSTLAYATLLWPVFAAAGGLYPGYGRALHDELARGVRAAASASITLAALALVVPEGVPLDGRALLLIGVVTVVLAPFARLLAKLLLRAARLWGRPVALLGTGPIAARLARYLLDHPGLGLHPVAAFGDADWDVPQLPITGSLDRAWSALPALGVRHAIVAPEAATRVPFDEVLRRAERSLRYVQFVPDLHGVPAASVVAAPIGTTLGLEVRHQLASRLNRALKRAFDLLGGLVLLLALGPALLAIAAWVRLDSRGPALYLSPRVGRYGRTFRCVKFRTMHVDAEARLARLLASDPRLRGEYERFHKLVDDPRVTRAGRWLRKLSLDEFAQLINVVRGDMSLVGPRPYLVRELPEMGPERDLIVLARPGMTGYWQVEGRNDVSFEERQAMEAAYVRNWSVWWDVELMLRTPLAVVARTGK